MPWSLIKDKVEIDSDFVSCAEYQLYIDEQTKKGENPRPNHWMGERFPRGSAKQSITGIKASDAKDFCRWLTQLHSSMGVIYRLPTLREMEAFPIADKGVGSWCTQGNGWIIGGVENSQWQTWENNLFQVLDTAVAFDFFRTLERFFNRISDLDINVILTLDYVDKGIQGQKSQEPLVLARNHALMRVRKVARNLARNLALEQSRIDQITGDLHRGFFLDDTVLSDLLRTIATELDENSKSEEELIADLALALDIDLKYQGQLKNNLKIAQKLAQIREEALGCSSRFYRILKSDFAKTLTEKVIKIRQFSVIKSKIVELDFDVIMKLENEVKQTFQALRSQNNTKIRVIEQVIIDAGNVELFNFAEIRNYLLLCAGFWHWLSEIYIKAASSETATAKKPSKYQELSQEYTKKCEEVLHIYTSFVFLEERQNNRLSAWEGLRLVREWSE